MKRTKGRASARVQRLRSSHLVSSQAALSFLHHGPDRQWVRYLCTRCALHSVPWCVPDLRRHLAGLCPYLSSALSSPESLFGTPLPFPSLGTPTCSALPFFRSCWESGWSASLIHHPLSRYQASGFRLCCGGHTLVGVPDNIPKAQKILSHRQGKCSQPLSYPGPELGFLLHVRCP